jgi:hypothetical protein
MRWVYFAIGVVVLWSNCAWADWQDAARNAVAKIESQHVNFKKNVPSLKFIYNADDPGENSLASALMNLGYTLSATDNFPEVKILKNIPIENKYFWERPYRGYFMQFKIRDGNKDMNAFTGYDLEFDSSPYQIPIRIFLIVLIGFVMYKFIYMQSLQYMKIVWVSSGFIWFLCILFLVQGYFIWPEVIY